MTDQQLEQALRYLYGAVDHMPAEDYRRCESAMVAVDAIEKARADAAVRMLLQAYHDVGAVDERALQDILKGA